MKENYQKALKKVTFFLLSSPVPFNRQNYQKQKGPGTSDQLLFRLRNKFRKIPLLVMYYLSKFDDVIQSGFWVILKITSANLCKAIYDIINYSIFICPFESGKCGKEGKNIFKIVGKKWPKVNTKISLFHSISEERYLIWLWFISRAQVDTKIHQTALNLTSKVNK